MCVQCLYCSKAFINESFLRAHIARRHPESTHLPAQATSHHALPATRPLHAEAVPVTEATPSAASSARAADTEFARELDEIRERLRNTESQLVEERNSRYELLKQVRPVSDCRALLLLLLHVSK